MRLFLFFCATLIYFNGRSQSTVNCNNSDFEATAPGTYSVGGAVSGWSVSSAPYTGCSLNQNWVSGSNQFYIRATPIVSASVLGILGHSPLGGSVVAQLNDLSAGPQYITRLSKTITVNAADPFFTYAVAGAYYPSNHGCCDGPGMSVQLRDCNGNLLSCLGQTLNSKCANTLPFVNYDSWTFYSNWQVNQLDLSSLAGSCVTIDFVSHTCNAGGHHGGTFLDARCGSGTLPLLVPTYSINYCGSGPAVLQATPGYSSYAWSDANGPLTGNTPQSSYTISNPVIGAAYQATLTSFAGCTTVQHFTIAPTQVAVSAIGATPSCSLGANGSATVIGTGSGAGYGYVWTNSTNSVVSTTQYPQNLAPGIYSVQLSVPQHSACGVAGATVEVRGDRINTYNLGKPFCGTTAYFTTNGGSNFQWYSGTTAISGTAGTSSSLTVQSPSNGAVIRLRYLSAQGCLDSIIYTLWQATPPASVSAQFNSIVCEGQSNGQATISLSPAGLTPITGQNSFSVVSTGSTATYSASVGQYQPNLFPITGLSAGGTYSVVAFDGSCFVTTNFSVPTFFTSNLFTVTTSGSPTLCQGQNLIANVVITNATPSSGYTYSWSPGTFITGGGGGILITPSVSVGASVAVIYTVVTTPTHVNCPASRTLQVLATNPPHVTLTAVPDLCTNTGPVTLTATPPGGSFSGGTGLGSNGVLTPSVASAGVNTYSYTFSMNGCPSVGSGSYLVVQSPALQVSANTTICAGKTVDLSASGAGTFQWQPGGETLSSIQVTPGVTTTYTVTGFNSYCFEQAEVTVAVFPNPQPGINLSSSEVCAGETLTVSANGAASYSWQPGNTSANAFTIVPLVTSVFTLTGISGPNCKVNTTATVVVNPNPNILVALTSPSVCSGYSVMAFLAGANNYMWNGTAVSQSLVAFTPSVSASYPVIGFNEYGCSDTTEVSVLVIPTLKAEVENKDLLLCSGRTITLTATGTGPFTWQPGDMTGNTIIVSPSVTTTYTVINSVALCAIPAIPVVSVVPCENPFFGLAQAASAPRLYNSNYYSIQYSITVVNQSTTGLSSVELTDELTSTFPYPLTFTVAGPPELRSSVSSLAVNNHFNGTSDPLLTEPGKSSLAPNETGLIVVTVNVDPNGFSGPVKSWVTGTASTPWNLVVSDSSNNGFECDPDKDGDVSNNSVPTVVELNPITLFVPDAFSPDGDGLYDQLIVKGMQGREARFIVFNRWGEEVFKIAGGEIRWDGYANAGLKFGKGKVPPGTYYYLLEFITGEREVLKGFVTLSY